MFDPFAEAKAKLTPEEVATLDKFEGVIKQDLSAFQRINEVVYQVTMKEMLEFAALLQAPPIDPASEALNTLCDKLEKLPRIGIKDGQTSFKVDYDNIDALIGQARRTCGIEHAPVPPNPATSLYFLKYYGPLYPSSK